MNSIFYNVSSLYPVSMIKFSIMSKYKGDVWKIEPIKLKYYTMHYRLWDDIYLYFIHNQNDFCDYKLIVKRNIYLKLCDRFYVSIRDSWCFLCDYNYGVMKIKSGCFLCPGYKHGASPCLNGLFNKWLSTTDINEFLLITLQIRDIVLR